MARRFKPSIKICLLLILFILIPLLILMGYNSCGLDPGFQSHSLNRDYASLKNDPLQPSENPSQPPETSPQPSGDSSQPSAIPSPSQLPVQKSEFVVRSGEALQKKSVDILFVIDHSISMHSIASQFSKSFKGFIGSLSGLDWRIAVTSMQARSTNFYRLNFGELLSIRSSSCSDYESAVGVRIPINRYILSPSDSCSEPIYCSRNVNDLQNAFMHTIGCLGLAREFGHLTVREGSHFGIQTVYKILNKHQEYQGYMGNSLMRAYIDFFRNDATLVMVFLTDTPNCEQSSNNATTSDCNTSPINSTNCNDFGIRSTSDFPADLVQKVRCVLGENKKFFAYPIIPTTFSDTEHYVDLAKRTQGRISDWTKPLIRIDDRRTGLTTNEQEGKYTAGLRRIKGDIDGRTIQLKCKPSDEVPASGGRLRGPGPIYLFRPDGETTFQRVLPPPISPGRGPKSHYEGTFMVRTGDGNRHLLEIIEYWKTINLSGGSGQGLNKVRFTTRGYVPDTGPSVSTTTLPPGTYRVEYSCADSQE